MSRTPGTFSYPGSKTTIAPWIIDHIPEHHLYVEPFGGAGSILVAKPRSEKEVYNDLNGDCVDFFRAVRDHAAELKRWIANTPYSRQLFNEYVNDYPDWPNDIVERAGRFLYVQNTSFGGKGLTTANPTFKVSKCQEGRQDRGYVLYNEDYITDLRDRLKGVYIEKLDFEDLVEKYDRKGAFFYFDPPYVDVGDNYYQVEEGGFNHKRFVDTLHDMEGKWLVSYDQNLPNGLEDYRTISREKVATMSAQNPTKIETLTMNYDIDGEPVMSELGQQTLV